MRTPEEFWAKVDKSDGCWEWRGGHLFRRPGVPSYGSLNWRGVNTPAHRVAWMLTNGPIPAGLWCLHHCDNQGCVRPDHLYLGTHKDNTRDAVMRKRMWSRERAWNTTLREVDIRAIRALAEAGFATEHIGSLFHVSGRAIRYIVSGEHWRE